MKSDVIRKRSRHDVRRTSINGPEDTPSASPGPSRRSSLAPEASPTLAPDSTTQLSYNFEDSDSFRAISSSASELMGALGTLPSSSAVNQVGDTTQGGLYQTPSSPYNHTHTLSSSLASSSSVMSLFPGPDYLMQLCNVPGDALPFSSVDSVEVDTTTSPRSNKRRRLSTDSAEDPPSSAVSFASYSAGDGGYSSSASSAALSHGHSHSFSLSHNHSHSMSSRTHSLSLSLGRPHGHNKRSSMEFPFTTYNANGTINQGPVLRGSGNTFWHPPMLPQTGSDNESHLFHSHGNSSSSNDNRNESADNGDVGPSTQGGGNTDSEDSAMDYPQMQDEDSLFSTYVHPPMALPEEVSGQNGEGNEGNMHNSIYVDSYYQ